MSDWMTAVLIGGCIGAVLGAGIARYSLKELRIQGGPVAQVLHYLACALFGSSTPFIITAIVVGLPFLMMFGTAVGFIATAGLMVYLYGIVESQAQIA